MMLKILLILLFVFSLFSIVFTQPPPPAAPAKTNSESPKVSPWDSIKNLPSKLPFVSLEGRFSISFSKDIQGFAALSPKQLGMQATGMEFTWKFQEGETVLMFVDLPKSEFNGTNEELKKISENTSTMVLRSYPKAKITEEKFFKFGDFPVSQAHFEIEENKYLIQRLYLAENRLYRIVSMFKSAENAKFINQTFDTFKLISQDTIDAEKQKNFEALKPSALPQEPVAQKEKSDAEDENLKGKVKIIVQDTEDLSGTWSVQGRKPSSITYFNEKGNYTERISYDSQGNPFQITMYGYIDDRRVSNSKAARHEYDPPVMALPKAKSEEPVKKSDSRYEYSFEYKYEDGKLTEKQMVFSNSKKGMKYVYNHNGNQIEELVYTTEGELNQKYLVTLDENGYEIEKTSYGVTKIYPDRKYRYKYEFDEKGNWIKKTTFTETFEKGSASFKPSSITYRTITYF